MRLQQLEANEADLSSPTGQLKLKQAHILVIGAGGLGCPVLLYLAAAGVGEFDLKLEERAQQLMGLPTGDITILDHDSVELSNLHRQVLHSEERVGINKAQSAKLGLEKLASMRQIQLESTSDIIYLQAQLRCQDQRTRPSFHAFAFPLGVDPFLHPRAFLLSHPRLYRQPSNETLPQCLRCRLLYSARQWRSCANRRDSRRIRSSPFLASLNCTNIL